MKQKVTLLLFAMLMASSAFAKWYPSEKYCKFTSQLHMDKVFQFPNYGNSDNANFEKGITTTECPGVIAFNLMCWDRYLGADDEYYMHNVDVYIHKRNTSEEIWLCKVEFSRSYNGKSWAYRYENEANLTKSTVRSGCELHPVQKRMYRDHEDGSQFYYFHFLYDDGVLEKIKEWGDDVEWKLKGNWDGDGFTKYTTWAAKSAIIPVPEVPSVGAFQWYDKNGETQFKYVLYTDANAKYRQKTSVNGYTTWTGSWNTADVSDGQMICECPENEFYRTVAFLNSNSIQYSVQVKKPYMVKMDYWAQNMSSVMYTHESEWKNVTPPLFYYPKTFSAVYDAGKIKLIWTMPTTTSNDVNKSDFIIERSLNPDFSGNDNKLFKVQYEKTQESYSLTDEITEREVGKVTYYYRLRRGDAGWKFPVVKTSQTVNTNYTRISSFNAKAQKNKAELEWTVDEGLWTSNMKYKILYDGGTSVEISDINKNTYSINLASCTPTTFTLQVLEGTDVISSKEIVNFVVPSDTPGSIRKINVAKGFYNNRVTIDWDIEKDSANFQHYQILRKELNDANNIWTTLGTVKHTLGTNSYRYEDLTCVPGTYYQYRIEGWQVCAEEAKLVQLKESVGFAQPYGVVTGSVTYSGNQGVEGVRVVATGASNRSGRSLYFDYDKNSKIEIKNETISKMVSDTAFTFMAWVKPTEIKNGTSQSIFNWQTPNKGSNNVYGCTLTAGSGELRMNLMFFNNQTKQQAVESYEIKVDTCGIYNEGGFNHVAVSLKWQNEQMTVVFFLNGHYISERTLTSCSGNFATCESKILLGGFWGYMDEISFWNNALDEFTINKYFDGYLVGNEKWLTGYYRCDDDIPNDLFDISRVGNNFNCHHLTMYNIRHDESNIPTTDQLALKSYTDADGIYQINNIPFTDEGSQYKIIPTFGIHEFAPSTQPLFFNSSASTHNKIDFTDKSSFEVSGVVYYENTDYPVKGCNLYVDGNLCAADGKPIETDENGHFTISVPIGDHYISVQKTNHLFKNNGRYPAAGTYTFDKPMTNLTFYDSTTVLLAGRVAGGEIEEKKPHGFAQGDNNIGKAEIVLSAGDVYNFNLSETEDRTFGIPDSVVCTSVTKTGKNGGSGAKRISISTDANTGEFYAKLPPIDFTVESVKIPSNDDILFDMGKIQPVKLGSTDINQITKDSLVLADSTVRYFEYLQALDVIYYVEPTLTIHDTHYLSDALGEQYFYYYDKVTGKTDTVQIFNEEDYKCTYNFNYPCFSQGTTYNWKIRAYEKYENKDRNPYKISEVPLQQGIVTITNELGQRVVAEKDTSLVLDKDSLKIDYKKGEIIRLGKNQLRLDNDGMAIYTFTTGVPNIIEPYTLGVSINYSNSEATREFIWNNSEPFQGVVLGALPSGTNFVTKGPNKILYVLRDPPGSGSSATVENTRMTMTYDQDTNYRIGGNEDMFCLSLGPEATLGVGIGVIDITKVSNKNNIFLGAQIDYEYAHSNKTSLSYTMSESVSTSSEQWWVGENADVFIGLSTNILYGNSRAVTFDKNEQGKYSLVEKDAIYTSESFNTDFRLTQKEIETEEIPKLKELRNACLRKVTPAEYNFNYPNKTDEPIYITTLDESDPRFGSDNSDEEIWKDAATPIDSIGGPSYLIIAPEKGFKGFGDTICSYNSDIASWIHALEENERIKVNSIATPIDYKNYSFDSGTTTTVSYTEVADTTECWKDVVKGRAVFGSEFGFHIKGLGSKTTLKGYAGGGDGDDEGQTAQSSTKVSFKLQGRLYEALSVDVCKAKDGFGPVFYTRAGQTYCPYEGEKLTRYYEKGQHSLGTATMTMSKPRIRVDKYMATDVPAGSGAQFTLNLDNVAETSNPLEMLVRVVEESNPKGAVLTIDGRRLTYSGLSFRITPGETITKSLLLAQSKYDVMEYDSIGVILSSSCDIYGSNDTVWIAARFIPSCSDISLRIDNPILNTETGDTLAIQIRDVNTNFDNFNGIRIQYRGIADANWRLAEEFDKARIDTTFTEGRYSFRFPMKSPQFPDQTYEFRAQTICDFGNGEVNNESEIVKVVKDMQKPQPLGSPTPVSGIWTTLEDVSVTFDKPIQVGKVIASDIKVQGVLNGHDVEHSVALSLSGNPAETEAMYDLGESSWTIESWVRYTDNGTLFSICDNAVDVKIIDGKMEILAGNGAYFSKNASLKKDTWMYVQVTYDYDSDAQKAYMTASCAYDANTFKMFDNLAVTPFNNKGIISIGENLQGAVHEVTLWNTVRSFDTAQSEMRKTKYVTTPNLIGYWPLNEGVGVQGEDRARNRHLVLPDNAWWFQNENYAAHINRGGRLSLNISELPIWDDEDYAVEMWYKTKREGMLWLAGDSILGLYLSQNDISLITNKQHYTFHSAKSPIDDNWHHIALNLLRNGNAVIYLDGVTVGQVSATQVAALKGAEFVVGNGYEGDVDEIRIWYAALSESFIAHKRKTRLPSDTEGLVAYYPFEKDDVDEGMQHKITFTYEDMIAKKPAGEAAHTNVEQALTSPGLKEVNTVENVNFSYTVSDTKIVINVREDPARIEDCILEFTVKDIQDEHGNYSDATKWTACVKRNQLIWYSDEIDIVKNVDGEDEIQLLIVNASGETENWHISNIPSWMTIVQTEGRIEPMQTVAVNCKIDASVAVGKYEAVLYLTGNKNMKSTLPFSLRVLAEAPKWKPVEVGGNMSLNIVATVRTENGYLLDEDDIVAAFMDGECVAVCHPTYKHKYGAYYLEMTVLADDMPANDEITFKVWDAMSGTIYPKVESDIPILFKDNALYGNYKNPVLLTASNEIEQFVALAKGWNWISFNIQPKDAGVDTYFKQLGRNLLIAKDKTRFLMPMSSGELSGTLENVTTKDMYKVRVENDGKIEISGDIIPFVQRKISLNSGWNWIGYMPQTVMSVDDALAGMISPKEGDLIKNKTKFAVYDGTTWEGTLNRMAPGEGYLLLANDEQDFYYPNDKQVSVGDKKLLQSLEPEYHYTPVDDALYQGNMTILAVVVNGEEVIDDAEVGVFANGECRATARIKGGFYYIVPAGDEKTELTFRVWYNNKEWSISKTIYFENDGMYGSCANPYIIDIKETDALHDTTYEHTPKIKKRLIDGQMYIIRNGSWSDALGRPTEPKE